MTVPTPHNEADDEDMSIESASDEDEGEQVEPLPTIQLSFDNSKGGAWDDRELVNAYDTAIEEFHLHHPGPGSWLDKATAAIAQGRPLPGAADRGTAWYSASNPENTVEAVQEEVAPTSDSVAKRRKAANGTKSKPQRPAKETVPPHTNPYHSQTASSSRPNPPARRQSPSYAPVSPTAESSRPPAWSRTNALPLPNNADHDHPPAHVQANGVDEAQPQLISTHGPQGGLSMLAVQPTGQVSPNDALSYAMTAQYWAGYWMGVAQAKSQPAPLRDDPLSATQIVPPTTSASNVFVTRQQFHSNSANGLRR